MTWLVQAVAMGRMSVWDRLPLPITTKHADAGSYNFSEFPPAGVVYTLSVLCLVLLGVLHFPSRRLLCKVLLAVVKRNACDDHLMNL